MILSSAILEINLKNLSYNYKYLKKLNNNFETAATIKANAYGLGDKKIMQTLYKAGCKHFFVATLNEAINLRKTNKLGKIYILNGISKKPNFNLKKLKIIPIVNSISNLNKLNKNNRYTEFGIHFDTGINRLGLNNSKLNNKFNKNLILIMSHYASADEIKNKYNSFQYNQFLRIIKNYDHKILKSLNNSAGLSNKNKLFQDLARPGISLYGGHNKTIIKKKIKPVIKLKAEVLQIKNLSKNQYVGYNQTFKTKRNIKIAIVGIGYADGVSRSLSNKGYLYYKNMKFKIIGRISMDTITIDITKSKIKIKTGMFLDIINYKYDIENMANKCSTISNEILTSISNRVERVYIK